MSALARTASAPKLVGMLSVVTFLALIEGVIRAGLLSRFIVPPPTEILGSFYRIIVEEHVVTRFLFAAAECLAAGIMLTVFGVIGGVIMQRFDLLRRAC